MKKLLFIPALLISLLVSVPLLSVERAAVIDMRTAVLATQIANDAFKALEEESEYAGNVEKAKLLQSERQSLAEKLQKDAETLSQEEIADMQRDIQEKSKDLEFIMGKIQAEQNETAEKVFRDLNPSLQKILSELIAAKEIKLLLGRENVLFADTSLDLPDDVNNFERIICEPIVISVAKKLKIIKRGWKNLIFNPLILFKKKHQNIYLHFDMHHGYNNLEKAINLLYESDKLDFLHAIFMYCIPIIGS